MKIGRAFKQRYCVPRWTWNKKNIDDVKEHAQRANLTPSRFIERVVSNYFLLHKVDIEQLQGKRQDHKNKRVEVPKWKIHEDIQEVLNNTAKTQDCYMGKLTEYIVENYIKMYSHETNIFKIIS